MRIENLTLKNYRQLKNVDIYFAKKKTNDLHVIIGKNGTGKTNILNSINWCLYGDEPHLSKESQQLPILNLKQISEIKETTDAEVLVKLHLKTENGVSITVSRKAIYRVYVDEKMPAHQRTDVEVCVPDAKGNVEIKMGENAESFIERIVPKSIREFFFFDGERLDTYFKEATVQNIRHAIFLISQIDLLEDKIEKRLKEFLKDLQKEAGKNNPNIEIIRNNLQEVEDNLSTHISNQTEFLKQKTIANKEIKGYDERLRGIPDIAALEEEKQSYKTTNKKAREIRDEYANKKTESLYRNGFMLMLWPSLKKTIDIINEKREKNELPPPIDMRLLSNSLEECICKLCGQDIDKKSIEQIKKLIKKIKFSPEDSKFLLEVEPLMHKIKMEVAEYENVMKNLTHQIINYEKELEKYTKRIENIDSKLSGYNQEKVRSWHKRRKDQEELKERYIQQLAEEMVRIKSCEEKQKELEEELENALKKEKKSGKLRKDIEFCSEAHNIIKDTKEVIMKITREKIEKVTQEIFFDLVWKSKTFKEIHILDSYDLELIHTMGYECLGSISAAERELLALSFTLALHEVSGFDSPFIIDTPVARVTDENRENLGRIFANVGEKKQIILLFTPNEYSEEISKVMDKKSSSRRNCVLSSDETEATLKEL